MRISSGISRPTSTPMAIDDQIQHQAETLRPREGEEEQGRGEAADQTDHQFDGDEAGHEAAVQEAREPTADAHGEQVAADDRGKLKHAVAQQIAGERAGDQLIDQPARGDQEDGKEEKQVQANVRPRR